MAAKWAGKCKRCGFPIRQGQMMDWVQKGEAYHLTEDECAIARVTPEPVLRGPQPEDPEERMIICELLLPAPWKAATSKKYQKMPHEYTLRRLWENQDDFNWCVEYIRRVGYERRFIGRVWTYYDIGDYQYWDCGGPVADCGLINRARRKDGSDGGGVGRKSSGSGLLADAEEGQG